MPHDTLKLDENERQDTASPETTATWTGVQTPDPVLSIDGPAEARLDLGQLHLVPTVAVG